MQILVRAVPDIVDFLVVHGGGGLDLVGHLLQIVVQRVEKVSVPVVLELDLLHEVRVPAERLVDGGLVLRDVVDEVPLGASAVAVVAVVRLAEVVVPAAGAHGVVQVPDGAGVQLVRVRLAVPVEQDAAGAHVVVLVVLVHEIHLGKALDVDVVGIVFTLGVGAVRGADGVPGVLEPGLDHIIRLVRQVLRTLVGLSALVVPEEIIAHLLDGDAVVAGGPAGRLVQAVELELGITALGDAVLEIVVLFHLPSVLGDEGVGLWRDGVAALVLAVHPYVGGGGVLADPHLVGQMETDPVAQQAAVEHLGEEGPLLGLFRGDAREVDLLAQRNIIRLLVVRVVPGSVAAALHLGQLILLPVDKDLAGAGVVLAPLHGRDRALGLVDLDEDRCDADGPLVCDELQRRQRCAPVFERVGRLRIHGRDRALAAAVGRAAYRHGRSAVPGQAALGRDRVAGEIDLIRIRGIVIGPAGPLLEHVDPGRDVALVRRFQPQRRRGGDRFRFGSCGHSLRSRGGSVIDGESLFRELRGTGARFRGSFLGFRVGLPAGWLFRGRQFRLRLLFRRHGRPGSRLPVFMVMLLRRSGEWHHLQGHEEYENDGQYLFHRDVSSLSGSARKAGLAYNIPNLQYLIYPPFYASVFPIERAAESPPRL